MEAEDIFKDAPDGSAEEVPLASPKFAPATVGSPSPPKTGASALSLLAYKRGQLTIVASNEDRVLIMLCCMVIP